jgi:hypothetical protein
LSQPPAMRPSSSRRWLAKRSSSSLTPPDP